jgi:hypothetical protein
MKTIIYIENGVVVECVATASLLLSVKSNQLSKVHQAVKFVKSEMINSDV